MLSPGKRAELARFDPETLARIDRNAEAAGRREAARWVAEVKACAAFYAEHGKASPLSERSLNPSERLLKSIFG